MNVAQITDIIKDWDEHEKEGSIQIAVDLAGADLVYHEYNQGGYEGTIFTLYLKDGVLYECNGSHCSCYGNEDQWCPEPTSKEALLIRNYWGVDGDAVKQALEGVP